MMTERSQYWRDTSWILVIHGTLTEEWRGFTRDFFESPNLRPPPGDLIPAPSERVSPARPETIGENNEM